MAVPAPPTCDEARSAGAGRVGAVSGATGGCGVPSAGNVRAPCLAPVRVGPAVGRASNTRAVCGPGCSTWNGPRAADQPSGGVGTGLQSMDESLPSPVRPPLRCAAAVALDACPGRAGRRLADRDDLDRRPAATVPGFERGSAQGGPDLAACWTASMRPLRQWTAGAGSPPGPASGWRPRPRWRPPDADRARPRPEPGRPPATARPDDVAAVERLLGLASGGGNGAEATARRIVGRPGAASPQASSRCGSRVRRPARRSEPTVEPKRCPALQHPPGSRGNDQRGPAISPVEVRRRKGRSARRAGDGGRTAAHVGSAAAPGHSRGPHDQRGPAASRLDG